MQRTARLRTGLGVAALAIVVCSTGSQAQSPAGTHLVVGTKPTEPFVVKQPDGSWSGLSIDLWNRILQQEGWACEYRELELAPMLQALRDGSLDAGVAAVTVTAEREKTLDFSHPFYSTGLGIAVDATDRRGWTGIFRRVLSRRFLEVVLGLVAMLLAVGMLTWLFERRRNPQQFGGGVVRGIGSGFWWSAVTMTTVGYGDKAPVTGGGRFIALVWMFAGIVLISGITAALTSALTVNRLESRIRGPEDLARVRVGTPGGTAAAAELRPSGIEPRDFASLLAALEALGGGEIEAVVYDEPILRYWARMKFPGRVEILPRVFGRQSYALALPSGSPRLEAINRSLLGILQGPEWPVLVERYLGPP